MKNRSLVTKPQGRWRINSYLPFIMQKIKKMEELDMSRWMYDPETDTRNGKEFTYNLPIHENDDLLIGFTYRQIIDEVIANVGRSKADEKAIRDQVRGHLEMAIENMEENLMLCIDNMLAEIKDV